LTDAIFPKMRRI